MSLGARATKGGAKGKDKAQDKAKGVDKPPAKEKVKQQLQATTEQMRMANMIDRKSDDSTDVRRMVLELMEMTCRTEEEVCSALHDSDNDMVAACNLLLEESQRIQGEWQTNEKKKKKPPAAAGNGEPEPPREREAREPRERSGAPRPRRGEAEARGRGRGAARGRARGARRGAPGRPRPPRQDQGERGEHVRGRRRPRGLGEVFSEATGTTPSETSEPDITYMPPLPPPITDYSLAGNNMADSFPSAEDWDNEEWSGSLSDTKVFTPSTATGGDDAPAPVTTRGRLGQRGVVRISVGNQGVHAQHRDRRRRRARTCHHGNFYSVVSNNIADSFPSAEDWDNEEWSGSLSDTKVFTPSTATGGDDAPAPVTTRGRLGQRGVVRISVGHQGVHAQHRDRRRRRARTCHHGNFYSVVSNNIADSFPSAEDWDNEEWSGSLSDTKVFTPSTATGGDNAPAPVTTQEECWDTPAANGAEHIPSYSYSRLPEPRAPVLQPTISPAAHAHAHAAPSASPAPAAPPAEPQPQPQPQPPRHQPMGMSGSLSAAQSQYLSQLTQQSQRHDNSVYSSNYGVYGSSDITSQRKPQRARVPPPSKIPSSAVEMPGGEGGAMFLDVQFGALEPDLTEPAPPPHPPQPAPPQAAPPAAQPAQPPKPLPTAVTAAPEPAPAPAHEPAPEPSVTYANTNSMLPESLAPEPVPAPAEPAPPQPNSLEKQLTAAMKQLAVSAGDAPQAAPQLHRHKAMGQQNVYAHHAAAAHHPPVYGANVYAPQASSTNASLTTGMSAPAYGSAAALTQYQPMINSYQTSSSAGVYAGSALYTYQPSQQAKLPTKDNTPQYDNSVASNSNSLTSTSTTQSSTAKVPTTTVSAGANAGANAANAGVTGAGANAGYGAALYGGVQPTGYHYDEAQLITRTLPHHMVCTVQGGEVANAGVTCAGANAGYGTALYGGVQPTGYHYDEAQLITRTLPHHMVCTVQGGEVANAGVTCAGANAGYGTALDGGVQPTGYHYDEAQLITRTLPHHMVCTVQGGEVANAGVTCAGANAGYGTALYGGVQPTGYHYDEAQLITRTLPHHMVCTVQGGEVANAGVTCAGANAGYGAALYGGVQPTGYHYDEAQLITRTLPHHMGGYYEVGYGVGGAREGTFGLGPTDRFTRTDAASPQQVSQVPAALPPGYAYFYQPPPTTYQYGVYPTYGGGSNVGGVGGVGGVGSVSGAVSGGGKVSSYSQQQPPYDQDSYKPGGGYNASGNKAAAGAPPELASAMYAKPHVALNKVNSYDKAAFHSGTPPPFGAGSHLYIPAPHSAHHPHHHQHQMDVRVNSSHNRRESGAARAAAAKPAASKPSYSQSYWAPN
ncbi:protein lingerer-like [Cydia fagiglandana]|uniref:protein lingerer-like n=1 Tax=Cydia fagiglandana TaxID=1458189 RepID=UPI002FEE5C6B